MALRNLCLSTGLALLLMSGSGLVLAQESHNADGTSATLAEPSACAPEQVQTQIGMNICAQKRYEQVDQILNRLYRQVMALQRETQANRLLKAQLAWLKFRDLQCAHAAGAYEGGSIAPLIYSTCLTDLTSARNRYLQYLLKDAQR